MYICTLSVCFKQAHTLTHTRVWGTAAAHNSQEHWRTGRPGPEIQQELTQQLSCLWFQKCVHLWSKLKVLSVHVFFKNKIHLQKWSFSSIPLPAVKKSTATNYFVIFVTPHPSWGDLQFLIWRQTPSILRIKLYADAWVPNSTVCRTYSVCMTSMFLMGWWRTQDLGAELPQHLALSLQQCPRHLAHGLFCKPFCL